MSSRVLRPAQGVPAESVDWPVAGASAGSPRPSIHRSGVILAKPPSGSPEQELHQQLDAARQRGRAEAESDARRQAQQELAPVLVSLRGLIDELDGQRKRLRAEAEEDTVKLAVAIARRVLHRELSIDPEAILGLVKAAYAKLNARETHRLRVSPRDAAVIEENRARLIFPPGLEIARDSALPEGSAVFETVRGELDASVDTQFAEIERGLTDVMRRRSR